MIYLLVCRPRADAAGTKDKAKDKDRDESLNGSQEDAQRKKKTVTKKRAKGKDKAKLKKRRRSSGEPATKSGNVRRSGSDVDGEWREAWKKAGVKAKSDHSENEDDGEEGESGYESSKSVRDEVLTEDEFSSSESTSSSSSAPSSGIKKKGKAILEFISRDRIKRDDEADEPHRASWLWRRGSREKVIERDNVIIPTLDDLSLYDKDESLNSQLSPRVRAYSHDTTSLIQASLFLKLVVSWSLSSNLSLHQAAWPKGWYFHVPDGASRAVLASNLVRCLPRENAKL
jgi:hypothetical protein